MQFCDTHCHIHEHDYVDGDGAYERALQTGVTRMICVGTDLRSSLDAVTFADTHEFAWASLGLHPHDAKSGVSAISEFERLLPQERKIVAIGECGLDYFYNNSPKEAQVELLHAQLQLASNHNLPVIFHVREAFDDFWSIFDQYKGLSGVLHSFTDTTANLEKGLSRGLYVGVNGISTFVKDEKQLDMYRLIPIDHMLLETDAPFLTPVPLRGKVNEPAFVTHVAHFIANLQSINLEELSRATEQNATTLFFK